MPGPTTTTSNPGGRDQADRRPLRARAWACSYALLGAAALAGAAPAGAAPGRTTTFTGRIVSATGTDANLRRTVRLVLRASAAQDPPSAGPFAVRHYRFTLALSAPSCKRRAPGPRRRCVALAGKLAGTALVRLANPDGPKTAELSANGRVTPFGAVSAAGTTAGLGFIRSGRFPLTLRLQGAAGSVTIKAQGPLAAGFSSPF